MNDDLRVLADNFEYVETEAEFPRQQEAEQTAEHLIPAIPDYLQDTYWWAYLHPKSVWLFEREWVVNLILWGNMKRLTQAVLNDLHLPEQSRVLQLACVYGKFSNKLAAHLNGMNCSLDLVDVADIQLQNARNKLSQRENVSFHHQDSTALDFASHSVDETVVFFLLHEQPEHARRKTIVEAIRVTRPGGRVVFVDYHGPRRTNPMRYVMKPVLAVLEPYALDLWREELKAFMPNDIKENQISTTFYFGGLYQKVVLQL